MKSVLVGVTLFLALTSVIAFAEPNNSEEATGVVQATDADQFLDLAQINEAVTRGSCWARGQAFDKHGYHIGNTRKEALSHCLGFHSSCESQCGSSEMASISDATAHGYCHGTRFYCSNITGRDECIDRGCFWSN